MAINTEKTKNMMIFFVSKMENITAIKLQKAMLFADRMHWSLYKKSISGLEYVKAQYGPVMEKAGKKILKELDESVFTVISTENECSKKNKYISKRRFTNAIPDVTVFLDEEISSLEQAYRIVRDNTDEELVAMTHDETWENAEIGDILSYENCIHEGMVDRIVDLSTKEEKIINDAIEKENYKKLEDLARTWI